MDDAAPHNSRMTQIMQGVARQVSLDPGDGMEM
jgi:type IV secretion system protein VirD4